MKRNNLDWKSDKTLALGIILLWSLGRVINPVTHAVLDTYQTIGPVLAVFEIVYVALHAVLFLYTCVLMVGFFRRYRLPMRWGAWGELVLYIYVLITLLLSLYFIAYEFGYLPLFLQNLLPFFAY